MSGPESVSTVPGTFQRSMADPELSGVAIISTGGRTTAPDGSGCCARAKAGIRTDVSSAPAQCLYRLPRETERETDPDRVGLSL
jgi:hypothetical protein